MVTLSVAAILMAIAIPKTFRNFLTTTGSRAA